MAATKAGRLVISTEVATNDIRRLVNKLSSVVEDVAPVERALNTEAGVPLFDGEPRNIANVLFMWDQYQSCYYVKSVLTNGLLPSAEREYLEGVAKKQSVSVRGLADKTDIFQGSQRARVMSMRSSWDEKCHRLLLLRYCPGTLSDVNTLLRFRETVGRFPDRPRKRWIVELSEEEEAFMEAWKPYATEPSDKSWKVTWRTYQRIRNGQFVERETQLRESAPLKR